MSELDGHDNVTLERTSGHAVCVISSTYIEEGECAVVIFGGDEESVTVSLGAVDELSQSLRTVAREGTESLPDYLFERRPRPASEDCFNCSVCQRDADEDEKWIEIRPAFATEDAPHVCPECLSVLAHSLEEVWEHGGCFAPERL